MTALDMYFEEVCTKEDFLKKWDKECEMVYQESMETGKPLTQKKWLKLKKCYLNSKSADVFVALVWKARKNTPKLRKFIKHQKKMVLLQDECKDINNKLGALQVLEEFGVKSKMTIPKIKSVRRSFKRITERITKHEAKKLECPVLVYVVVKKI